MVRVVAAREVSLGPGLFDEDVRAPALEGAGAGGDTGDDWVGGVQGGFFGAADGGVDCFGVVGPDARGCEVGGTKGVCVLV